LPIKEIGFGRLEGPDETTLFGIASIDLDAVRDELKQ